MPVSVISSEYENAKKLVNEYESAFLATGDVVSDVVRNYTIIPISKNELATTLIEPLSVDEIRKLKVNPPNAEKIWSFIADGTLFKDAFWIKKKKDENHASTDEKFLCLVNRFCEVHKPSRSFQHPNELERAAGDYDNDSGAYDLVDYEALSRRGSQPNRTDFNDSNYFYRLKTYVKPRRRALILIGGALFVIVISITIILYSTFIRPKPTLVGWSGMMLVTYASAAIYHPEKNTIEWNHHRYQMQEYTGYYLYPTLTVCHCTLYFSGGIHQPNASDQSTAELVPQVAVFDYKNQMGHYKFDLYYPRVLHAGVCVQEKLLMFCGGMQITQTYDESASTSTGSNTCEICTSTSCIRIDQHLPANTFGVTMSSIEHLIYIFGGYESHDQSDQVLSYDTRKSLDGKFQTLKSMTNRRNSPGSVVIDTNSIIVCGGQGPPDVPGGFSVHYTTCDQYNIRDNTWTIDSRNMSFECVGLIPQIPMILPFDGLIYAVQTVEVAPGTLCVQTLDYRNDEQWKIIDTGFEGFLGGDIAATVMPKHCAQT